MLGPYSLGKGGSVAYDGALDAGAVLARVGLGVRS